MKMFLVLKVLFYPQGGVIQKEICTMTFQSEQTVSLMIEVHPQNVIFV